MAQLPLCRGQLKQRHGAGPRGRCVTSAKAAVEHVGGAQVPPLDSETCGGESTAAQEKEMTTASGM